METGVITHYELDQMCRGYCYFEIIVEQPTVCFKLHRHHHSDIPVTETQTDTEMIDISKTHTETNTEKILNTDTTVYTYRNDHVKN